MTEALNAPQDGERASDAIIASTRADLERLSGQVQRQQAETVSLDTVITGFKDAVKTKKWDTFLKTLVSVLTGKAGGAQGVGYVANNIEQMPDAEKSLVVNTVQSLDQTNQPWDRKMMNALLATNARYSFYRKGYAEEQVTHTAVERVEGAGVTLPALLKKKLGDARGEAMWKDLQETDPATGTRKLMGPLVTDQPLPQGSYVYFDAQSRPIWIASTDTEKPVVSVFTKERTERPRSQIDFLEKTARVGDVVFVGSRTAQENSTLATAIDAGIHFVQGQAGGAEFFGTHVLVVVEKDGVKQLAHLDRSDRSSRFMTFAQLPGRYGSAGLSRVVSGDQARVFSDRVVALAPTLTYSTRKAIRTGGRTVVGGEAAGSSRGSVCTDLVTRILGDMQVPGYGRDMTPFELFRSMPAVAVMDLHEAPRPPRA